MTAPFSTAGIRKIFSFPFADPRWKSKFLISIGVTLSAFIIPILPMLVLLGYYYRIMHRVIVEKEESSLPEWNNWGKLLGDGFKLFGVSFVYSLPILFITFFAVALYIGLVISLMLSSFQNPDNTAISLLTNGLGFSAMINPDGTQPTLLFFGIIFLFLLLVVTNYILAGILSIVRPLAWCQTVAKDSFGGGFEISRWRRVFRANFGGFFLALLMIYGTFFIIFYVCYILYMSLVLI